MDDFIVSSGAPFDCHRLHKTAARSRSIPGVNVHMLRIQTLRAMVGVAVADDAVTTMFAYEILYAALKLRFH